jgi:translation elongation factor EF-4
VPPKGGNRLHNKCADGIKFNAYRGANALVNGKAFDALQIVAGVLWEVKTDNFDSYPLALKNIVLRKNVHDFLFERELARACGFDFRVGVRSATHKAMLEIEEPQLEGVIVLMDWC